MIYYSDKFLHVIGVYPSIAVDTSRTVGTLIYLEVQVLQLAFSEHAY